MSSDDAASTIAKYNSTAPLVASASAEVNDYVFTQWYSTNWGDLLQPAPMAVLILGNLSVVATAADFKLIAPQGGFEHVRYPDSFRATIVQLVDSGTNALEKSYANFDEIQKRCAGVKPGVNAIVTLLAGANASSDAERDSDIKRFLPSQINQLQAAIQNCLLKAQETDTLFEDLLNLTMEVHESCTATQGDNDQKLRDAAMRQTILEAQRAAAVENKELAKQQAEDARNALQDAQKQFDSAANDMPKSWDLIGMEVVEGITSSLIGTFNRAVDAHLSKNQGSTAKTNEAVNNAGSVPTKQGDTVIPASSNDPGFDKGATIYKLIVALEALAIGGSGGAPDWDHVSAQDKSGSAWLRNSMQLALDGSWGTGDGSTQAQALLKKGVELAAELEKAAPTKNDDIVSKIQLEIKTLSADAMTFATTAMNKTGVGAILNPGLAAGSPSDLTSGTAAQMAVKNAQFKLEATQKQLDAARQMSENATNKLLEVTTQLGQVLGQIASLNTQQIDWDKVRTILLRTIGLLCDLKSSLANLVLFFHAVNNLVSVSMNDSVNQFIQLITDATKPDGSAVANKSIAGITFSAWTRQTIYNQALGAAKVARLVEDIAKIYLNMYINHVQSGVQKLLLLGKYITGTDADTRALSKAVSDLETWANTASKGITTLIKAEQDKMQSDVEDRVAQLQQTLAVILPAPPPTMKQTISDATQAHVDQVGDALATAAANKPANNLNLGGLLL